METPDFRLYWWIKRNIKKCRHNLSSSGLSAPPLEEMGVHTDYAEFESVAEDVEEEFKAAVAQLYGVRQENVLPTVGGTEAIYLVNLLVSQTAKAVFVPKPNYEPMMAVPRLLGLKSIESPPTDGATVLVSLTDTNNPTGRSLRNDSVEELLNVLQDDSILYIDETFREFGFPERPKTWFREGDQRIIVSNTLTKFYGLGGMRVGWIVAGEDDVQRLAGLKAYTTGESPTYSLWVGAQTLKNRSKFVQRAKEIVGRNRKIVEEFVESTPMIDWSKPDAAPFCLIEYSGEVHPEKLCSEALSEAGVLIAPATFFGGERGFRLCFTHTEEEPLVEALEALSKFLGERLR